MKISLILSIAVLFVACHIGQSAPASRRLLQWPYRPNYNNQRQQPQQRQRQEPYIPPYARQWYPYQQQQRGPYAQVMRGVDPEEQMERREDVMENQQERFEDAFENGQPLRQVAPNGQVIYNSQSREVFGGGGPAPYNQMAAYAQGGSTASSEVYSSVGGSAMTPNAYYRNNRYQAWNPNLWD